MPAKKRTLDEVEAATVAAVANALDEVEAALDEVASTGSDTATNATTQKSGTAEAIGEPKVIRLYGPDWEVYDIDEAQQEEPVDDVVEATTGSETPTQKHGSGNDEADSPETQEKTIEDESDEYLLAPPLVELRQQEDGEEKYYITPFGARVGQRMDRYGIPLNAAIVTQTVVDAGEALEWGMVDEDEGLDEGPSDDRRIHVIRSFDDRQMADGFADGRRWGPRDGVGLAVVELPPRSEH